MAARPGRGFLVQWAQGMMDNRRRCVAAFPNVWGGGRRAPACGCPPPWGFCVRGAEEHSKAHTNIISDERSEAYTARARMSRALRGVSCGPGFIGTGGKYVGGARGAAKDHFHHSIALPAPRAPYIRKKKSP